MNTERAATHTETLAAYRENRQSIRAVQIISDCCPTCDLDSGREYALDAVPLLPHLHCTNPNGCHCYYSPVLNAAKPVLEDDVTTVYPPPMTSEEPRGLPAYLRTPTAAMIVLGALVISFVIGRINSTTGIRSSAVGTQIRPQRIVPFQATRTASMTRSIPERAITAPNVVAWDRKTEAQAARDLRNAEATAKANESALQAHETAVRQQAYLQNLFGRQGRSAQSESAVFASTSAISN